MVIVFYTDLRIFWAARDGDKLGQHRERDILSGAGPPTGNLRWSQGVRSSEVQMEMESMAHKQSGKESVRVRVELHPSTSSPLQSMQ